MNAGGLPNGWIQTTLDAVLTRIEAGKSLKAFPRPAEDGESGVLKLSAITWGHFQFEANKALPGGVDLSGIPTVGAGDLLISRANTTELVGAVAIPELDHGNLILSDKTLRLVVDPQLAHHRYLFYALRSPAARQHIESRATGTSGSMRNISQSNIRDTPIPLPPLTEQHRIAAILDEANALRRKRRQALGLLDELLRSAFLEMFGDAVTIPTTWEMVPMGACMVDSQYGTPAKANTDEVGFPVLRMNNLTYDGRWDLADLKWVEIAPRELAKYTVRPGDLLFNRTNSPELVGKTGVWHLDEEYAFAGYLIRIRLDEARVLPDYVSGYLNSVHGKQYLFSKAKASNNMSNFSASLFREIPLLLPPLELQRRYRDLVAAICEERSRHSGADNSTDGLFNSLLHLAFTGNADVGG